MKLLRVGDLGSEIVAALDSDNNIRDLSEHIQDLNPQTKICMGDWLDLNILIINIQDKTTSLIRDNYHEYKTSIILLYDCENDYYRPILNNTNTNNYFNNEQLKPLFKYFPIKEKIMLAPKSKTIKTRKTKTKLSMEAESDKKLLKDDGTLYSIGYYKLSDLVELCSEYNVDVHNICTDGQNLKTKTKKELYTSILNKII